MSKKNIARTAIEGGRAKSDRDEEYDSTVAERRAYKIYCHMAVNDPDVDEPRDNAFHEPWCSSRRGRDFADKLSPVKRWLESHVGKSWNAVLSEIKTKFPSNTLAGRHILEHIKGFVMLWEEREARFYHTYWRAEFFPGELYVDEKGFLRQAPKMDKKKYYGYI